jgi:hypothetical protein
MKTIKKFITHLNFCILFIYYTPTRREGAILQSPCSSVRSSGCPSVRPFVRPSVHTVVTDISVWLRMFHVCRNENFRNSYRFLKRFTTDDGRRRRTPSDGNSSLRVRWAKNMRLLESRKYKVLKRKMQYFILFKNCGVSNYTPTHRVGAILQSPCSSVRSSGCPSVRPFVRPSVHTVVTDISVWLRMFHAKAIYQI